MKGVRWLSVAWVLALLAAACGGGNGTDQGTTAGSGATTVNVELKDFAITPEVSSATPGEVTFSATNAGPSEHELVVIKTDIAPDQLPVESGAAEETGTDLEAIGEIKEFASGGTESATFDLEAGNYVLICNIPAHYESGMAVGFEVT